MTTTSRLRRTVDFGRLRLGAAGPGADTRCWVALGRVDDDPEAIRWDAELGWLVDVTLQGGPLDQEGPVVCRMAVPFAAAAQLFSSPPARGQLVVVVLPGGNANEEPVIVGQLHASDHAAPGVVNGETLDEAKALGAHLLVTGLDVDEEVGGSIRRSAAVAHRLLGETVELAQQGAAQSYVRGEDLRAALLDWTRAVAAALSGLGAPIAGDQATLESRLNSTVLSSRIKGE